MNNLDYYLEQIGKPSLHKISRPQSTTSKIKEKENEEIKAGEEDIDEEYPDEELDIDEEPEIKDENESKDKKQTKRRITIRSWLHKLNTQFKPYARFKYNKEKKYFAVKPTGEEDYMLVYPNEEDKQEIRDQLEGLTEPQANEKTIDIYLANEDTEKDVYELIRDRAQELLKRFEDVKDRTITEDYRDKKRKVIQILEENS